MTAKAQERDRTYLEQSAKYEEEERRWAEEEKARI